MSSYDDPYGQNPDEEDPDRSEVLNQMDAPSVRGGGAPTSSAPSAGVMKLDPSVTPAAAPATSGYNPSTDPYAHQRADPAYKSAWTRIDDAYKQYYGVSGLGNDTNNSAYDSHLFTPWGANYSTPGFVDE